MKKIIKNNLFKFLFLNSIISIFFIVSLFGILLTETTQKAVFQIPIIDESYHEERLKTMIPYQEYKIEVNNLQQITEILKFLEPKNNNLFSQYSLNNPGNSISFNPSGFQVSNLIRQNHLNSEINRLSFFNSNSCPKGLISVYNIYRKPLPINPEAAKPLPNFEDICNKHIVETTYQFYQKNSLPKEKSNIIRINTTLESELSNQFETIANQYVKNFLLQKNLIHSNYKITKNSYNPSPNNNMTFQTIPQDQDPNIFQYVYFDGGIRLPHSTNTPIELLLENINQSKNVYIFTVKSKLKHSQWQFKDDQEARVLTA